MPVPRLRSLAAVLLLAGAAGCSRTAPTSASGVPVDTAITPAGLATTTPTTAPSEQVAALVAALGRAMIAPDGPGPQVVDPSTTGGRSLRTTAATMRRLGVDRYTLSADARTVRVDGDRATVIACGSYHVRSAAPQDAPLTLTVTARRTTSGWRVVSDRGEGSLPQPWDLPGARRVEGSKTVVLGNADSTTLDWYAAAGSQAWADDAAYWSRRPSGAPVIVVPSSADQFAMLVRAEPEQVRDIAAMTVGSIQRGRTSRGDVVVVNPQGQQRLTEEGRRTILRHELVHVAIRATTTGTVPLWLTEGYAVQASWHGTGIPAQLRQRAARWSTSELLAGLPSDGLLLGSDPTFGYDISALLVDDLVTRHGRGAVEGFYLALSDGVPLAQALTSSFAENEADVVRHWRAALPAVQRR